MNHTAILVWYYVQADEPYEKQLSWGMVSYLLKNQLLGGLSQAG